MDIFAVDYLRGIGAQARLVINAHVKIPGALAVQRDQHLLLLLRLETALARYNVHTLIVEDRLLLVPEEQIEVDGGQAEVEQMEPERVLHPDFEFAKAAPGRHALKSRICISGREKSALN